MRLRSGACGRRVGLLAVLLVLLLPVPGLAATCSLGRLATLPVTLVGMSALVPVTVAGNSLMMLADSGTARSTLSARAAARLRLPQQPAPLDIALQGIGGSVHASLASVPQFTLAGIPLQNVQLLVGGETPLGAVGLLGQDVLGFSDVDYDLPDRVIRLMRPQDCASRSLAYWATSTPFAVVPLEDAPGHVAIGTAYVNGVPMRALFDTGAERSVLRLRAARRAGIQVGAAGVEPAHFMTGADGHQLRTWTAPVASFELGGEKIRHTRMRIIDAQLGGGAFGSVDMLLGADFFLSHHVYIANSQHKAYFTYTGGPVFTRTLPAKDRRNPCQCMPALAQAPGSGAILGTWQRHQFTFSLFFSPGVRYTREGLMELLSYLLTQSGARLNAPVEISYAGVSLDFSTFMPLTTDEAATPGIPGSWRPVLFSPAHSGGQLHQGDCEAVSEVATLLTLYSVRDIKAFLPCIPNRDSGGDYGLSFKVFVPASTPRNAVGG